MLALVIVLVFFGLVLMVVTYINRRNKTEEIEIKFEMDEECCGAHEVCDRDSLLSSGKDVEYYDDEELDSLAHIVPKNYTNEQINMLSEVFFTLKESDVAGWLRSLQSRSILLPEELKDQALLVVSERRNAV